MGVKPQWHAGEREKRSHGRGESMLNIHRDGDCQAGKAGSLPPWEILLQPHARKHTHTHTHTHTGIHNLTHTHVTSHDSLHTHTVHTLACIYQPKTQSYTTPLSTSPPPPPPPPHTHTHTHTEYTKQTMWIVMTEVRCKH